MSEKSERLEEFLEDIERFEDSLRNFQDLFSDENSPEFELSFLKMEIKELIEKEE